MAAWRSSSGEDAALFDAVEAVGMELCPALGITIPVGKDSLSMQTRWQEDGDVQGGDVTGITDRFSLCTRI